MANELKPCPFCGGNSISFRSTPDMDTDGKFHCVSCNECGAKSREKFAMDACPLFYEELRNQWNTRPATPVEGLVRYDISMFGNGAVEMGGGEYVLFDQVDVIIAAERAKVRHWQEQYTEMHSQFIDLAKSAEADNAALTARVKELGGELEYGGRVKGVNTQYANALAYLEMTEDDDPEEFAKRLWDEREAIETQLAAAKKAARSAHDTLIEINPSNYNHDDVCQMNDASVEAIFLLADVLGETHGKTAEWWKLRRAALSALEDRP